MVASFVGTILGGKLMDWWGAKIGGKSASMAYTFCATCALLSAPVYLAGFAMVGNADDAHVGVFFLCYGAGIIFTLMAGAVFPLAILWTVRKSERITVSSFYTFVVNVFGTVPAPVVVGELRNQMTTPDDGSDYFPVELMALITLWMIWPTVLGISLSLSLSALSALCGFFVS